MQNYSAMETTEEFEKNISKEDKEQLERIRALHSLIEENKKIDEDIENHSYDESLNSIDRIMKKANEITHGFEQRRIDANELVLDTELLRRNHEVFSKAIQFNSSFTDKMFTSAIKNIVFSDGKEDWRALSSIIVPHGKPFFTNCSMLPFIDLKPKQQVQKQRIRKPKAQVGEEKRPKKADKLEREENSGDDVNKVFHQLKAQTRAANNSIPLFKFIIDPDNFMDTVQNALAISFLLKENCIVIENGPDGYPFVRPACQDDVVDDKFKYGQAILQLDVEFCKKLADFYKIKEPMLKRQRGAVPKDGNEDECDDEDDDEMEF